MRRAIYEGFKKGHNALYGAKSESDFQQTGKLTPQEFVEAGDELTQKAPVWQWVGGPSNIQEYLPENKKCLVYRGASCFQRAPVIGDSAVPDEVDEFDFVVTEDAPTQQRIAIAEEKVVSWDDDDDDNDTESETEDEDAINAKPTQDPNHRLYDVYIVYDKYYETPRIYLFGFQSDQITPLTPQMMKEDVFHSNYGKTVTIDNHPILGMPSISIHPCRHAETMKNHMMRIKMRHDTQQEELGDTEPFMFPTHRALFLFLKFISSVVPTIEYDMSSGFEI